jgi:hypothetical protein
MPERREEKERWFLAFRFPDMATAGRAYQATRDQVFGRDLDASVYRVQIRGEPHVIALGDGSPDPDLRKKFEEACATGERTEIPSDVRSTLEERRTQGKVPGTFWEGNYRPGIVTPTPRRKRRNAG